MWYWPGAAIMRSWGTKMPPSPPVGVRRLSRDGLDAVVGAWGAWEAHGGLGGGVERVVRGTVGSSTPSVGSAPTPRWASKRSAGEEVGR